MKSKDTMIRTFVLLAMIFAYLVYTGLPINTGGPYGEKLRAEVIEDKEGIVYINGNEIVTNNHNYIPVEDDPTIKIDIHAMNGKKGLHVYDNSDLFYEGSVNPEEYIIIDKNSYTYASAATISENITVQGNSRYCAFGTLQTRDSLTNNEGILKVEDHSVLYLNGDMDVKKLELDSTSYIYIASNSTQESTVKINGSLIDFDDYPNIITVSEIDERQCPKEPSDEPTGGVVLGKLKAAKSANKPEVNLNGEFEYEIVVENTVEDSLPFVNILIKDELPDGLSYVGNSAKLNNEPIADEEVLDENENIKTIISSINGGEIVVLTFNVKVDGDISGEIINVAEVINPLDPDNPLKPEVTVYPKGILAAEKTANPNRLEIGEEFYYTITVTNAQEGSKPFKDVVVSDILPDGIAFVDGKIKVNGVEEAVVENNSFEVTLREIAYGTPVKVSFKAKATEVGRFENIATVQDDSGNEIRPRASVEVIPKGILAAAKTASADKVMIGDEYEYTITVSNDQEGSSPLKDVTVKDTLPAGIEFVDGEIKVDGVAEANAEGNHFEVTLSEVAHGRPVEVSFMVRTTIDAVDRVTNTATVTSQESEENPSVDVDVVRGSVEITKVDNELAEDGKRVTLEGAKFALYQCPEADSPIESCSDPIKELTTGSDGKILFEDLESGYYWLVETQAPEGYNLLTKRVDLGLIDVDRYEIQKDVINYKTGWELPTTGGMGTYWFYSLGVLFMLVALYATRKMKKVGL